MSDLHSMPLQERRRETIYYNGTVKRVDFAELLGLPHTIRLAPTSALQSGLWFLHSLGETIDAYKLRSGVRLSGVLDVGGLEWAIGEVIGRHESLRTTFVEIDGEPWQVVGEAGGWELPREDLTGLGGAELEEEIRQRAEEMAGRGFDLERGPLFRAELLRLSDSEHVLLLSMHHIVSDGWSMDVLFRELSVLYEAYGGGSATSPLPELPVQYADYAMWQREWLEGGELARQLTYWKGKLSGAPELLELPTDRARSAVQSHRGGRERFDIPAEVVEGLRALGREEGATLFMVLLAAFKVLMARYSGQEDVVVGTSIANRSREEFEGLIGFFTNTLALRTDLSGEPSFREVLRRIRETTLEAYEHQDLPFAKLVEELNVERSPAYNPVFQVFVGFRAVRPHSEARSSFGYPFALPKGRSVKFDLVAMLVEKEDGSVVGSCGYSTDLFDSATIERMMGHYGRLLESVVEDVECPIYEMAMLGEDERRQLLEEWNETGVSYPEASVHELFEGQVERTPEGIAVECEGERYTYRELNERANQVAHQLRRLGVGPEVRVGLCVERGMELVVGMLGALKAGGAYVPLDPDYPPKRRAFMAEDSEVEVLLTQRRLVDRVPSLAVEVVYLDREEPIFDTADTMNLQVPVDPENLAYIIYTSGSTGTPKGVLIPHGAVAGLFRATDHHFRFDESDTWPLFHSYAFDFSVWEIWGALLHGSRLVIVPFWVSRSATAFGEFIRDEGITIVNQTPSAFMELRNVDGQCDEAFLSGVKYVVLGGEALDVTSTQDWLRERADSDLILCNMYGITEATVHSTLKRLDVKESATRHSAIGRPLPGWTLYVLDGGMQLVAVGVAGELYIGGAGLARGYWGRAGLTAERFVPNPFGERGERLYVTGDRVRWRSDGQLEFLGRFDDQVKVRGFRIEPGEVESVLMGHERVRDAVVVVQEDEEGDRKLVGYVVLEGRADGTGEVRRYLRDRLPEFMVPNYLVALDELPLNPSGKIDRASLPEPTNQRDGLAEYVEPRTRVEKVIAEIWSEVLGVEEIGIHDNFFELGGHSLLATRVQTRIRSQLGVEVPLRRMFESPEVASLAQDAECGLVVEEGGVRRAPGEERLWLSHAQERLWFLDRMYPGDAFYTVSKGVRLSGVLDVGGLEWAIGEVIGRHESLRTTFVEIDGEPWQVVGEAGGWELPREDLTGLGGAELEEEIRRRAEEMAGWGFDLERGPLFRAELLRLSDSEHVLLLSMHHIVSDGWSMDVLFRELSVLYEAYGGGSATSPLPELPVQYADYAMWQREWLEGGELARQLTYWKGKLSGAPELLELPTDRARPAVQSHRGGRERFDIPAEVVEGLRALGREEGATLFMVLLAAFKVLMARYSGQEDVVVGTVIANRSREEFEGLIGFFLNTLALRTDLSGEPSFREVLRRVRETTLDAYEHQNLPFEKLVEELNVERSLAHHPVFQVMFTLRSPEKRALKLGELEATSVSTDSHTAKFDLALRILTSRNNADKTHATLEFNANCFTPATVARLSDHFQAVLRAAVEDSSESVWLIPLDSPHRREHHALALQQNPDCGNGGMRLAIDVLEDVAKRHGDDLAIVDAGRSLTYQELRQQALMLASKLVASDLGPERRVGILMDRSAEAIVAIWGTLCAGAAFVPLDVRSPNTRLRQAIETLSLDLVLTDKRDATLVPAPSLRVRLSAAHDTAVDLSPVRTHSENLAYAIFTSGTTGTPKGVLIAHAELARYVEGLLQRLQVEPGARFALVQPLSFDSVVSQIFGAAYAAGTLYIVPESIALDGRAFAQYMKCYNISGLKIVPSHLKALLGSPPNPDALPNHHLVIGGEAAERSWLRSLKAVSPNLRIFNHYGATETSVAISMYEIRTELDWGNAHRGVPLGAPLTDAAIYVLDRHLNPVPEGMIGDIYIGGNRLARGYAGEPGPTAERFIPDPFWSESGTRMYVTGDRGRVNADGEIFFEGRHDSQVKLRGFRVDLKEIEHALMLAATVGDAACIHVLDTDGQGAAKLAAFLRSAGPGELDITEHRRMLMSRLPDYMVPTYMWQVEQVPVTTNGKRDERALREIARARIGEPDVSRCGPASDLEMQLWASWSRAISSPVGSIDREADFFSVGGNSLAVIRLLADLERDVGTVLSVRQIFQASTLSEMANLVERHRAHGPGRAHARPVLRRRR